MDNPYLLNQLARIGGMPNKPVSSDAFNNYVQLGLNVPQPNQGLLNNMNNAIGTIDQENIDKEKLAEKERNRNYNRALLLGVLGDAVSGRSTVERASLLNRNFQADKEKRIAEEERNRILAGMSDNERKIFETYGANAAFQYKQAQENAEITALQKQRQAQAFRDAGIDERSIALYLNGDLPIDKAIEIFGPSKDQQKIDAIVAGGFTPEEATAIAVGGLDPDDLFKNNKILSNENIIKNVNNNVNKYLEDSKVQDTYANITEAFGPFDGLQSAATTVTNPLGFVIGGKTNQAVNARTNLNNEIRANLVDDYSGRPNVFLLTKIEELIPATSFTSEFDAMQRYKLIKNSFDSMVVQLEAGINGNLLTDATKQQYADDLYKTKIVQAKLEAAIKGLEGDEKVSLEQVNENFSSTGKYSNFYLEE